MSDLSFTSSHNFIHLIATRYVSSWLEHILSGHAQITKTSLRLRIAACYSCIFTDPLCKRYRVSLLPSLLISKSDPRVSLTVLFTIGLYSWAILGIAAFFTHIAVPYFLGTECLLLRFLTLLNLHVVCSHIVFLVRYT